MITYDRGIRQTIHSTLRRFCGSVDGARRRAGIDATLHAHDAAALAQLGASCRRRDPAPTSRKRRLAALAGLAMLLGHLIAPSRPVQAQDGANPPISATASRTLYLPAVARLWHAWFDDAELDDAIRRAGYDPATADQHIVCTLDPSAVPPYLLRYSSCEQYLIGATPTEGTSHYIWYVRLGDGLVHGLEVGA